MTFADWRKKRQGKRAVHLLLSLMPVFSICGRQSGAVVKSGRVGEGLASYCFYIGFGLMFILVGNYFPKIRQNRTMGIKVKWALENEENWNCHAPVRGKVWVICGFACLLGALFPFSGAGTALMVASILSAAAVPTLYSYLFYRRQLREGKVEKIRMSRLGVAVTGILTVFILAFVAWVLFSGDMEIRWQEDGFYGGGLRLGRLPCGVCEDRPVSYEPDGLCREEDGRRTNGFGNLKMSMGQFYNSRFGDYIRYTFNDCPACVILEADGEIIVINGENEAATEEIYETIKLTGTGDF